MRKMVYYIDDVEFFRRCLLDREDVSEVEAKNILDSLNSAFRAEYTLYGNGADIERYELKHPDGSKMSLSELNGYQRGCILGECKQHFANPEKYPEPCGVIEIKNLST